MIEVNGHLIMTDELDILKELKRQLYLSGVDLFHKTLKSGDNIMTTCPFHKNGQEKKPSFGMLTKSKGGDKAGTCHCFGCGWSGSLSEMISNCFGYDDLGVYGTKWLTRNFLVVDIESRDDIDLDLNRDSNKVVSNKTYVSEEELDSYRYYHDYMYKRKLTNEVIELFDIGYDKNTDCLTFPVRDINGNTLFIARRSVSTKFFNYPTNVEKPVYGLYELSNKYASEVIICESMLDALTCWVYGKYAVALNGLGNDLQFEQLKQMRCRKFILATDMDDAGLKARKRIKGKLKGKLVTEYIWDVNYAKDINDMSEDMFNNLKEIF